MFACYSPAKITTQATPLTLITQNELSAWLATQSAVTKQWVQATGFLAKPDSICLVPDHQGRVSQVLAGVSKLEDFWAASGLAIALPVGDYQLQGITDPRLSQQIALAWGLGAYQFSRYKEPSQTVARLVLSGSDWDQVTNLLTSIYLVRDLINTPAEDMGPEQLAEIAVKLAHEFSATVTQIIGSDLKDENYPAIYAVGRAAAAAPRLIDLRWGKRSAPRVTLIGKGVCFDTGGLDIKSATGMLLMKKDMGGAAHALGLARLIMAAKLPIQLRVLIPAVENAISAAAYRPGDVLETRQGLTVEITNTDAEGRLILADTLTEASAEQPELMIDFATLTGAARVALGPDLPALFCNEDRLAQDILRHAELAKDPAWRMPLHTPYRPMLDSRIASLCNAAIADGYAGAITAALFLQEFVPEHQAWVHIDLMAWNLRSRPGRPEGGEAMTLRAIFGYLKERYA